jgi:hypothetical protein
VPHFRVETGSWRFGSEFDSILQLAAVPDIEPHADDALTLQRFGHFLHVCHVREHNPYSRFHASSSNRRISRILAIS